jgi:hypothetical protein
LIEDFVSILICFFEDLGETLDADLLLLLEEDFELSVDALDFDL